MVKPVMHRIWLQGYDRLPDHLAAMCDGFDQLHPDWIKEWWDEERILDELDLRASARLYRDAEDLVPSDSVSQLRADIARYAILRTNGGVAADVDYYWHQPIDPLLKGVRVGFAYEVDNVWVASAFQVAPKGHTVFTKLLDRMSARAEEIKGRGLRANALSGPKYLTKLLADLNHTDVTLFPADLFHAVPWSRPHDAHPDRPAPGAYATHAWQHQRGLRDGGSWKTW